MENRILLRNLVFLFLLFILSFPVVYLLFYVEQIQFIWDPTLLTVLKGALLQAGLSTFFTLVLGFLGALGFLKLRGMIKPTHFDWVSLFAIVPSFLPVIIIIVLFSDLFGFLPTGLWGVVFFHTMMNVGLVSLLIEKLIFNTTSDWYKLSLVSGVHPTRFILKGLLPELRTEWMSLGFYLMVLYFFSFSVPLIVGGTTYGGIEVYIYEKIIFSGDWGSILPYVLSLSILLFLASRLMKNTPHFEKQKNQDATLWMTSLGSFTLLICALTPSLLLFLILFKNFFIFTSLSVLKDSLPAMRVSLIIGLLTGFFMLIWLSMVSFCFLSTKKSQILLSWMNPGWVVVGFSLLLMGGEGRVVSLFKTSLGLSLLFFPYLYRLSMDRHLKSLSSQILVAETFPVPWNRIFLKIIWPQMIPHICLLSALAGLWALGDFALAEILLSSSQTPSLALEMKDLMTSYRLNSALALVLPLLFPAVFVFLVFQGLSYVSGRKISS